MASPNGRPGDGGIYALNDKWKLMLRALDFRNGPKLYVATILGVCPIQVGVPSY